MLSSSKLSWHHKAENPIQSNPKKTSNHTILHTWKVLVAGSDFQMDVQKSKTVTPNIPYLATCCMLDGALGMKVQVRFEDKVLSS